MNTNKHEFEGVFLRDEVFKIVDCAMRVSNVLGPGLLEKPYENALVVEFDESGVPYEQQKRIQIFYKNKQVGDYYPDLIAFGKIIVEIKSVSKITDIERAQTLNYMRLAKLKVGIILNFQKSKLEWERLVL